VHETGLAGHLTDIAFGNGTFVAVGWDGQIVQSDPVSAIPSPSAEIRLVNPTKMGPFSFEFTSQAGETYTVQSTSDFNSWTALGTLTANAVSTSVTDTSEEAGKRFYRVVKE